MGRRDNQGRDLDSVKRHFESECQRSKEGASRSAKAFCKLIERVPLADWTTTNGVKVLRSGSSRYVGAPRNGKESAATFDVIDLEKGELVVQLKRDEVRHWLHVAAIAEKEGK